MVRAASVRTLRLVAIVAALLLPAAAESRRIVVGNGGDDANTTACAQEGNPSCTLRGAVLLANADPEEDVVEIGGSVLLSAYGGGDDAGTYGDLDVTSRIVVLSPAGALSTITGADGVRIFDVHPGGRLTLQRLILTGGVAEFAFPDADVCHRSGGAICVRPGGHLTMRGVTVQRSSALRGGGIFSAGELDVGASAIVENVAESFGGGIAIEGPFETPASPASEYDGHADIIQTFVGRNRAGTDAKGAAIGSGTYGGGVVVSGRSVLTVAASAFLGNVAAVHGGGLALLPVGSCDAGSPCGRFDVLNSTFSGNTATAGEGGGIYLAAGDAAVTLRHLTVALNGSRVGAAGLHAPASGLAPPTLSNSILAKNDEGSGPDCQGVFTAGSDARNYVERSACTVPGGVLAKGLLLGALDEARRVHPLDPSTRSAPNAAIDAGARADCLGVDQLGALRTTDDDACDLGAFERLDDRDGDGTPDVTDTCPDFATTDQTDADEDGIGAACECNDDDASRGRGLDDDGDGVPNERDCCPGSPTRVPGCDAATPAVTADGCSVEQRCSCAARVEAGSAGRLTERPWRRARSWKKCVKQTVRRVMSDATCRSAMRSAMLATPGCPALHSRKGDRDGDGVPNRDDNCPRRFNPIKTGDTQPDRDGDGLGNACDPDLDGDDKPNATDNCPWTPNPSQYDADCDRTGNACDPDNDNDGRKNEVDPTPIAEHPAACDH